jgi:hypothetical protein
MKITVLPTIYGKSSLVPWKEGGCMNRTVYVGKYTQVVCLDESGAGNACHEYRIEGVAPLVDSEKNPKTIPADIATVSFQNGPIQENGVNGVQNEDLIAICIDRLRGFQSGKFSCRENAIALTKLEEAQMWLRKRTADREARGVEGKTIV